MFVAHHDAAQRRADLPARADAADRRRVPAAGTRAQQTSPQMMRLVAAGPALAALGALPGCNAAPVGLTLAAGSTLAFVDIGDPHGGAGRQRQPDRRRRAARARAAAARASRSRACACCSSRPARRSRSWRACAAGCARHGPSLDPARTRVVVLETLGLAGADPARGRGDDLDERLRRRACATSSPRARSGAGVAAAARPAARLRHRRAARAARRAAGGDARLLRRVQDAVQLPLAARRARATSTTRRSRRRAAVAEAAIRRAASARG